MKKKIAIIRGKFLNRYEMQSFEPLIVQNEITAFSSLQPIHQQYAFPLIKLLSPMDIGQFPYKMQLLNRMYKDAQYLYGLENALRHFDIAHSAETYFHFTQQSLQAKKKGFVKKVVVTVWENIPFNNEGIRGRKEMKQRVLREADHFIAVSERAKTALLLEGASEEKITVVHPGINTQVFHPNNKKNHAGKSIHLLFVGRLVSSKGIYELVEALKLLVSDKSLREYKITLSMIGNGSAAEKKKLIQLQNRLHLTQKIVTQTVPYTLLAGEYQNADIFIAPSKTDEYWQEQWNMALMEAQASALPIITTYSGSIPENVGDAAILIQPADVRSLYLSMKQLITHKTIRAELGRKARKRAVEVHDIHIAAKKISEVYEKVLSR